MIISPAQAVHNLGVAHIQFFLFLCILTSSVKKIKGKGFFIALLEIRSLSHYASLCHILFGENKCLNKSAVDVWFTWQNGWMLHAGYCQFCKMWNDPVGVQAIVV